MPGLYGQTMDNLERIKETHPNLYNVWKSFLERRKERMFHLLRQCNTMINEMNDMPDIDPMVMLMLYHISTTTNLNT
tara:strand:- start:1780 stop:2010 length:231 start_codon:yes stop_codon:yes gene_type:complete